MHARTLKVPAPLKELIRGLHPDLKRKVRAGLADILDNPNSGKPLEGELKGLWSLRIGRHRVIYRPDDLGAEIVAVGPRRTIYEDTTARVRREREKKK